MDVKYLRPVAGFAELRSDKALCRELPYWDFLDDAVVLADGSLILGAKLQGLAIETLDSDRINQTTLDLRAMLNSLPDGFEVNFVHELHSDYSSLLSRHKALAGEKTLPRALTEDRTSRIEGEIESALLLKPALYVFLYRRHLDEKAGRFGSFFSSPQRFIAVKRELHEAGLRELKQVQDSLLQMLESAGVRSTRLSGEEAWSLVYRFLNPGRADVTPAPTVDNQHRELEFYPAELEKVPALAFPTPREQLVFSDLVCRYGEIFCDGHYQRCLTLKTMPEVTYAAMASRLAALPFSHRLQVHIAVPEQSKELSALQSKRRMAHSMSISPDGRAPDLESEARLNSTEELLRELINTGQKIFYFQCSILLRAPTLDELDSQTKMVLGKFRELNGAEAMAETVGNFKVWKTMLPFGTTTMVRPKRIKTDNLADFLPVYQPYEGPTDSNARPVCLFRNRSLGLLHYDPFDPKLPNYNALVTGSSGAGKSFVNNLVLLQFATQDPLIYIIDIGGSYRKLSDLLGGQYIEIAPPQDGEPARAINPFELPPGASSPSPHKLKFLLSLLENIFTDQDGAKLSKLDKSVLEESLTRLYEKSPGGSPTMSALMELLSKSPDSTMRNFARMLYPWTGSRPYGLLLEGRHSFDVSSSIVVFDLKGLSNYPDLQSAMILIITDFILGQIEAVKDRRKRIYMDECWELLKSRGSQSFMEYCVRTLRKTGSGITFITQGLEEIAASQIGPAILSNTATKFILLQRGDLAPTRNLLKLNDQEMTLISSLRQSKGHFSEAFLVTNEDRCVIRIQPTPLEYWIATSDAADNQLLAEYRSKHPSETLEEAIHALAKTYPKGASE